MLNRRIDSIQTTIEQVAAWQAQHNRMDAKVDWSFTTENARKNLNRRYRLLIVDTTLVRSLNLGKKMASSLSCVLQSRISRHDESNISESK